MSYTSKIIAANPSLVSASMGLDSLYESFIRFVDQEDPEGYGLSSSEWESWCDSVGVDLYGVGSERVCVSYKGEAAKLALSSGFTDPNETEAKVWSLVKGTGLEKYFVPVLATDRKYRWILMEAVRSSGDPEDIGAIEVAARMGIKDLRDGRNFADDGRILDYGYATSDFVQRTKKTLSSL